MTSRLTKKEAARLGLAPSEKQPKRHKYGAIKTEVAGKTFDSRGEARRYAQLEFEQKAGVITDLQRQVRYELRVNGELICVYVADHVYKRLDGVTVVEDFKSAPTRTPDYRIKKKLMHAIYGIEILEVGVRPKPRKTRRRS